MYVDAIGYTHVQLSVELTPCGVRNFRRSASASHIGKRPPSQKSLGPTRTWQISGIGRVLSIDPQPVVFRGRNVESTRAGPHPGGTALANPISTLGEYPAVRWELESVQVNYLSIILNQHSSVDRGFDAVA
jgi:hypothetical protein